MLILFTLNLSFATTNLNVNLLNQNPEVVAPGNFVTVNVKVSNSGSSDLKSAVIEMVENDNFQIAQGEERVQDLGIIPAFSGSDASSSSSFSIAKFKVYVDPKTPSGLNTIKFNVDASTGNFEYEFDLEVEETNAKVKIEDLNVDLIEAGDSKTLSFKINNDNSVVIKDVVVSLDLESVEDTILSTMSGTNQYVISSIDAFDSHEIKFDLSVAPDADAKQYLLPIEIDFEDSLGNSHEQELTTSVKVFSTPILSFKLDSQDSFTGGNQKLVFAIANPGTSTIKGLQAEILAGDNYEVIEGGSHYVGNLNPDDFQTVQSNVYIKEQIPTSLNVNLKYLDSYNKVVEETVSIPVKVYSNKELMDLGLSGKSEGSGSSASTIIVALIVGGIAFFIGRRLGYKKGKLRKQ